MDSETEVSTQLKDAFERFTNGERLYCLTIKPVGKDYKGDKSKLTDVLDRYINKVLGRTLNTSYEKEGTPSLHMHALIQCPIINNKHYIASHFKGYHINAQLIRKNEEIDSIEQWDYYINKEKSESEHFWDKFGNCFLPVDTNEGDNASV